VRKETTGRVRCIVSWERWRAAIDACLECYSRPVAVVIARNKGCGFLHGGKIRSGARHCCWICFHGLFGVRVSEAISTLRGVLDRQSLRPLISLAFRTGKTSLTEDAKPPPSSVHADCIKLASRREQISLSRTRYSDEKSLSGT
jgi:hypothetical protein